MLWFKKKKKKGQPGHRTNFQKSIDQNQSFFSWPYHSLLATISPLGVTLAQLVKASVGQADVQRFEPHLRHNWMSCGVFLVKSRHFGLPLAQIKTGQIGNLSLSGWLGRYRNVEYLQSLYLKRRGQLLFQD